MLDSCPDIIFNIGKLVVSANPEIVAALEYAQGLQGRSSLGILQISAQKVKLSEHKFHEVKDGDY